MRLIFNELSSQGKRTGLVGGNDDWFIGFSVNVFLGSSSIMSKKEVVDFKDKTLDMIQCKQTLCPSKNECSIFCHSLDIERHSVYPYIAASQTACTLFRRKRKK